MLMWLLAAAAAPIAAPPNAVLKMPVLAPVETAHVAKAHTLDLRLSPEIAPPRPQSLIRGMIVQKDLAPNAFVGAGLSNLYARKKRSSFDAGDDLRPKRSKKPAVTFVLKF